MLKSDNEIKLPQRGVPSDPESNHSMKSNLLRLSLSAGLFLLPALSLHAEVDAALKVEVDSYYQSNFSTGGKFDSGKVKKVRINSKQLLKLVSQEKGFNFPSGSKLMVTDVGYVYVANSKGQEILAAAPYIQMDLQKSDELFDGKINVQNDKENARTYYKIVLKLDLSVAKGSLSGVAIEKVNVSEPNRDGIQKTLTETKSPVNGKGVVNGGTGYFDGNIKLQGRGAVIR